MSAAKLFEIAHRAAAAAQAAGAKDARIKVRRSRQVTVEWRDGKVDRISESTEQSLTAALYVDGRFTTGSTCDLRDSAVADYLGRAVVAARFLAPDEHRRLPNRSRYDGMVRDGLELEDGSIGLVTPAARIAAARELEEAVRLGSGSEAVISVTSAVSDTHYNEICLNTNGLEATEQGTQFYRGVEVSVRDDGDRKPEGSSWRSTRFLANLPDSAGLGRDALERALAQRGSQQIATGHYDLVVENRMVPGLVRHLLGPLSGSAVQQKRSFFEGRLGTEVASKLLTIRDEPHLARGLGTGAWDREGMATRCRSIIEKGILKTFFLDTYYGSKLKSEPTTGSPTNIVWECGKRDGLAMVSGLSEGLLVTGFLGGNSNATTGDFSLGIRGFYVKQGSIVQPVSEMNIAGNHLELWKKLNEVGGDPWPYSANRSPSLLFEGVQCSGSRS